MTSVIFTGDIGFDRYMSGRYEDSHIISGTVLKFFRSADHVVANVEGALINSNDVTGKGMFFHAMDPKATGFLKLIQADIWNLANNHSMDAEEAGLRSTLQLAKECSAQTVGAGLNTALAAKPAYITTDGGIGIFGCGYQPSCTPSGENTPGNLSWNDFETIEKTAKEIKKSCRHCVLIVHGGEEFTSMPMPYIRARYRKYLDLGVDIIVAHHPHVPQNYELFDGGKAIFYSLGNFIFDTDYQRCQPCTDRGVLLKLNFTEDGFTFEGFGIRIVRGAERIEACKTPAIFAEVNAENYEQLAPLAARAFIHNEKKRRSFLNPDKYGKDSTQADWDAYFAKIPNGYIKDEHNDYFVYLDMMKKSGNFDVLPAVREYLEKSIF